MENHNPKSRSRRSSSSSNKKKLPTAKTKKNNNASAAASNKLADDFFNVINENSALESKLTINEFAGKQFLDEIKAKAGITEQHKFTTSKIQQMIRDKFITSKSINTHKFVTFRKVILIDFENLWNVIGRNTEIIFSIINTINTKLTDKPVLFIFIMPLYHRKVDLFNVIISRFKGPIAAEVIYIDRNVDNLSEPTCLTKYGFNESDDYLLLKIFRYLSHFKIPVEVLSADLYSYKKNINIVYLYLTEDDRKTISDRNPFNPYEYYMQFDKANIKAIKEADAAAKAAAEKAAKAAAEAAAKARKEAIEKAKIEPAPSILHITGERRSATRNPIVYYSEGSQYDKITKIITYHNGLVGTFAADGNIHLKDGRIEFANGDIQYPNGVYVYSFGKILYPDGIIQYPYGTIQYLDGTIQYPNETLEYTDGKIQYPNETLEYPN